MTKPSLPQAPARQSADTSGNSGVDWRAVFAFPNPVNEYAARITAGLVTVLAVATLLTGWGWGLIALAAGFWLRVLFGPRISPLALLSVKVLAPRIGHAKLVAGPPKRFAQGIGAALTSAAVVLFFTGFQPAAWVLLAMLIVAASLESLVGFCLGCAIFGFLQRLGLIPAEVCEACNNIALRGA
ncbi:protein of unknown function [Arthrobacter sp. yr096]|uniref:DUF4395 domain-containing protein n=1 Tax=unclassified Arthrobacter TaxID=235627 RepID=UPI00089C0F0A|nr:MULTISPECIES: DUF4395 domain-containing protein [unclassified Arthrobacter]SDW36365.1 protein of unknown function [Arthrobacter sp. cf158]SEI55528.1 protein of unknown function [Arthrobacter sp. yr096]